VENSTKTEVYWLKGEVTLPTSHLLGIVVEKELGAGPN
jgi:hypothetical protein